MMRDAAVAAIDRALKLQGVTRAELARRSGISRSNVSHLLNASDRRTNGNITSDTIDRLLGALGYEVATVTIRKTGGMLTLDVPDGVNAQRYG